MKSRHFAAENELTSDMASIAAKRSLGNAGVTANDVDIIIVATTTPDLTFPATAARVQALLASNGSAAFDIQSVCAGFIYAMITADAFIRSGKADTVLVIGAETMSRILDWNDRKTCVLFGDGAGSIVLQKTVVSEGSMIIDSIFGSDGRFVDILKTTGGPACSEQVGKVFMAGKEVFRHAVDKISATVLELLSRNGLTIDDIDYFVPHQANLRIIESVMKKIALPTEKTIMTIAEHSNTSAASIPLALDWAVKSGKIVRGNMLAMAAFGGGLSWGGALVRW
jgi:3-oxoacyl-[acyl-carrier-protein] synthase-3